MCAGGQVHAGAVASGTVRDAAAAVLVARRSGWRAEQEQSRSVQVTTVVVARYRREGGAGAVAVAGARQRDREGGDADVCATLTQLLCVKVVLPIAAKLGF